MLTIHIKIEKEDKLIIIKHLESACKIPSDLSNLNQMVAYEQYIDVLSKLRATQHNSKAIRLNLSQARGFWSYLSNVYVEIGDYELANGTILAERIRKDIVRKILTLK